MARTTGTNDTTYYNVISTLYHLLQGCQTTEKYLEDVRKIGNDQLIDYFEKVYKNYRILSDEGKVHLANCLTAEESFATIPPKQVAPDEEA